MYEYFTLFRFVSVCVCADVRACVCFINLTLHIKSMQVKGKLSANKNEMKRKTFSFARSFLLSFFCSLRIAEISPVTKIKYNENWWYVTFCHLLD